MSSMGQPIGLLDGGNIIHPETMKQQAYDLIKDAILYRRLQIGITYSQDALCNELRISRTPVREALLELQNEGYITFMRGKGIQVTPVTHKRARDIVEARYFLEVTGTRLAAGRRSEENLRNMTLLQEQMSSEPCFTEPRVPYQLDREFHREIFLAADNSWLQEEMEQMRDHFLRIETQTAFDRPERATEVLQEHQAILDAIRAGDAGKAVEAMRHHLDCTIRRTIDADLAMELSPIGENDE